MKYQIWVIEIFDPRMEKAGWVTIDSLFHLPPDEDIPTAYGTKKEAEFNCKRIVESMKGSLVAIRYRVSRYVKG